MKAKLTSVLIDDWRFCRQCRDSWFGTVLMFIPVAPIIAGAWIWMKIRGEE